MAQHQVRLGIVNAYNYWIEVIQPNWIDFDRQPTSRTAFNLAHSLWSVIDWIKNDPAHEADRRGIADLPSHFTEQCPVLDVVHDLCIHGKHFTVGKPRAEGSAYDSESLTGAAFTFGGRYGPVSEQTVDFEVVAPGGQTAPLKKVFMEAMDFWHEYFLKPRPPAGEAGSSR